jgi:hypothetical protein
MITGRNKFKLNQVPGSDANSGCLFAALLPCYSVQTCQKKTQNNCPSLLSTLPTRENVLAPGYQRISWPPSPKPPATRTCPLINMIQPVSPVSLSEHTHPPVQLSASWQKGKIVFPAPIHLRMARTSPSFPALFLPTTARSYSLPTTLSPVLHFIKILISSGFSGIFALRTPPLAAYATPVLTLFYFFFPNFCHSSLNAFYSLNITQLIMFIFFN